MARFTRELEAVGGVAVRSGRRDLAEHVKGLLREQEISALLVSGAFCREYADIAQELKGQGVVLVTPGDDSAQVERTAWLSRLAQVGAGMTEAVAGLAETGTIVLPGGPGRSQLASLLPPLHLAVLRAKDLHANLSAWLAAGGAEMVGGAPDVVLVTGPSRTADIELTLTIGVHGPESLIVLLVDDPGPEG